MSDQKYPVLSGTDISAIHSYTSEWLALLDAERAAHAAVKRQNDELAVKLAEVRAEVEVLKTDAVAEFRCPDCGEVMTTHVGTELKAEVERLTAVARLRASGCECSDDDMCRFARERDQARRDAVCCWETHLDPGDDVELDGRIAAYREQLREDTP